METLKAQKQNSNLSSLKLNQLDLNTLDMIIKGVWIFENSIDEAQLKSSLITLLEFYPQLSGRLKDESLIECNNCGIDFSVVQKPISIAQVEKNKNNLDEYNPGLRLKGLKKGQAPLFAVQLTQMTDGCVLSIHCAHLCMDGNSFFKMVHDLSDVYNQKTITPPELSRPESINEQIPDKEEAQELVLKNKWKSVPFKALFQFFWQKITRVEKNVSSPIFIPEQFLKDMQHKVENKTGEKVGQHALISAILVKLCSQLNYTQHIDCSQVSVVDIRDRTNAFPASYIGNAVTTVTTSDVNSSMSIQSIAAKIRASIMTYVNDPSALQKHVLLNMAASKYKLPYTPFDLLAMNAKKPTCFYVNNLLKFTIYDVNFGGTPSLVLPNDLPDAIKVWPAPPESPGIKIYFRGYLAKKFNAIKDPKSWIDHFLKDIQKEI